MPVLKALVEKNSEKSNELLKLIDWTRFRYVDNKFLRFGDKRISVNQAQDLLVENGFKAGFLKII